MSPGGFYKVKHTGYLTVFPASFLGICYPGLPRTPLLSSESFSASAALPNPPGALSCSQGFRKRDDPTDSSSYHLPPGNLAGMSLTLQTRHTQDIGRTPMCSVSLLLPLRKPLGSSVLSLASWPSRFWLPLQDSYNSSISSLPLLPIPGPSPYKIGHAHPETSVSQTPFPEMPPLLPRKVSVGPGCRCEYVSLRAHPYNF